MSVVAKDVLEKMQVDPRRQAVASCCPFCADGTLVVGYSVTSGNVCLGHSSVKDPTDPTGKRVLTGCDTFTGLVDTQPREFLRLARVAGARWSALTD